MLIFLLFLAEAKPLPATDISDDPNTRFVMDASSADLICSQSNVLDTFWKRHEIDISATTIIPEQIPADTEELSIWRSQVQDLSPMFGRKFKFLSLKPLIRLNQLKHLKRGL